MLSLTVLYENHPNPTLPNLATGHGFSAYIEMDEKKILFDTGWDADKLLTNCAQLEVQLEDLDAIIISHAHWDHSGGLNAVLRQSHNPAIFIPDEYSHAQPKEYGEYLNDPYIKRITDFQVLSTLSENIATTGCIKGNGPIGEQALLLRYGTGNETLLLVGCSHPGLPAFFNAGSDFGRITHVFGGIHGFNDLNFYRNTQLKALYLGHCTQHYPSFSDQESMRTYRITVGSRFSFS